MKKAFAIIGAWALAAGGLVAVHVTSSDAAPPVPLFTQCPPVDTDTGCAVLLRLNADGSTTTLTDPNQPPLSSADGRDDVLIGVQNNHLADTVTSIGVSSNVAAFAFDGDGLCASTPPVPVGCPFDPTNSYAGPGVSFSNVSVDQKSGTVNFAGGIAPLGSGYFSLEGSETDFSGYSTGTDVFADVLRAGTPGAVLLNANAGFSGAAANSVRLNHIDNEMAMPVVPDQVTTAGPTPGPAIAGGILNSYSRGTGLELGIGSTLPSPNDPNQIILTALAEQAAPPPTPDPNQADGSVLKQITVPADPLLWAGLLTGQAKSAYTLCPANQNLAQGRGAVAHLELLNLSSAPNFVPLGDPNSQALLATTGGSPGNPTNRTVISSRSLTHLVPNPAVPGAFSLVTETHQSIAPITLFKGTPNQVTIEVLGEGILTAQATGQGGGATVSYTPPSLIRIIPLAGPPTVILPPLNAFGIPPIVIPTPGGGLAQIFIGEGVRAPSQAVPGNDASATPAGPIQALDGSEAWGAVDVIRIRLLAGALGPGSDVVQLRLMHMESQAIVPAPVVCPTFAVTAITVAPPTPTTTTTTTTAPTTTTSTSTSTTTTTAPTTTTTTTAPTTTTSTSTSTTSTSTSTTSTTQPPTTPPGTQAQQTTTTSTTRPPTTTTSTTAPPTTTTTAPATVAAQPVVQPVVQPQVLGQTFAQTPPASAVTFTPSFTG